MVDISYFLGFQTDRFEMRRGLQIGLGTMHSARLLGDDKGTEFSGNSKFGTVFSTCK